MKRSGRRCASCSAPYPVDPHGLVAKAGVWYLLGGTPDGIRTFRVSRVIAVSGDDATFQRPTDLDLDELWQQTRRRVQPDTSGGGALRRACRARTLGSGRARIEGGRWVSTPCWWSTSARSTPS
ncbi:MAG: WYL domain-containing protein [Geodermatophilaceae bacterium]